MEWSNIIEIAYDVLILLVAIFFYYGSKKNSLIASAENAIARAEEVYSDATNAGGEKFEYAVDLIYTALPASLRLLFPRDTIANIVQSTFDRIEEYAVLQLNRFNKKLDNVIEEKLKE